MIEVDVQLSKDGYMVIIHDETLDRTTSGKGYVKDKTLTELKKFDAGKGESIPTLQDVIDLVRGKAVLAIDTNVLGVEKMIVELVRENEVEDSVFVSSLCHPIVKRIKQLNQRIKTGVTFMSYPIKPAELALNAQANILLPYFRFVSSDIVKDAHRHNLEIYAWTVNDFREASRLVEMGIDGITTDKPDILSMAARQLFKKYAQVT